MSGSEGILPTDQNAALVEAPKRGEALPDATGQPARRRGPRVRDVDFTRPKKFSQDQQKRLERAHEAFCRAASARLTAELRSPLEFELINLDQLTWSAAVAEVPTPSVFGIVHVQPLDTRILLSAEMPLVMRIVECLLGGASTSKNLGRDLTEIETTLARRTIVVLVDQLSLTWDELFGVQLALGGLEVNVGNVQIAPISEPCLAFTFEARVGFASATLSLTVPHMAIESVTARLGGGGFEGSTHDASAAQQMVSALEPIEVELRAEVAALDMRLDEVLDIRPGDVVRLGAPAQNGVTVFANETPAYRARPGRNGRRRAIQVLERIEEEA